MRPMVGYITDKLIRREGNYMILKESWYDHTVYGMWYVVCGMWYVKEVEGTRIREASKKRR